MNSNVKCKIKYFNEYKLLDKNFKLGKMFKYDLEISYIKVYYEDNNIIFKSPMMYIPIHPIKIDNQCRYLTNYHYNIDLLFYNGENDNEVLEFENWYKSLEDIIYKLLKKRKYLKIKKRNFRTNFYYDEYKKSNKIKMKIDSTHSKFYLLTQINKLSNKLNINDIKYPTYGLFIIELQNIWIKRPIILDDDDSCENIFGINFIIHASQCLPSHCILNNFDVTITDKDFDSHKLLNIANTHSPPLPPPPPPPLFPSLNLSLSNNNSDEKKIPEFIKKYLDMVKKGIPRDAVKHKMKMQGLNPELLDNPYLKNNDDGDNNSNNNINEFNNITKITSNMLKNVKLKKCVVDEEKKKKKISNIGYNISLDDILNMKSKLKKQPAPKIYEKPRYNEETSSSMSDYTDSDNDNDNPEDDNPEDDK
jgi:hypothetical protein